MSFRTVTTKVNAWLYKFYLRWLTLLNLIGAYLLHAITQNQTFLPDLIKQLPTQMQPMVPWFAPALWFIAVQVAKNIEEQRKVPSAGSGS